ncbi:unannotated protein [freshwater metagenome]|uniref:Unannotated protein n=1 Tax=freshwater metagenome TaxID=449393 RepID=A0A6J6EGU9_9ZZZZ
MDPYSVHSNLYQEELNAELHRSLGSNGNRRSLELFNDRINTSANIRQTIEMAFNYDPSFFRMIYERGGIFANEQLVRLLLEVRPLKDFEMIEYILDIGLIDEHQIGLGGDFVDFDNDHMEAYIENYIMFACHYVVDKTGTVFEESRIFREPFLDMIIRRYAGQISSDNFIRILQGVIQVNDVAIFTKYLQEFQKWHGVAFDYVLLPGLESVYNEALLCGYNNISDLLEETYGFYLNPLYRDGALHVNSHFMFQMPRLPIYPIEHDYLIEQCEFYLSHVAVQSPMIDRIIERYYPQHLEGEITEETITFWNNTVFQTIVNMIVTKRYCRLGTLFQLLQKKDRFHVINFAELREKLQRYVDVLFMEYGDASNLQNDILRFPYTKTASIMRSLRVYGNIQNILIHSYSTHYGTLGFLGVKFMFRTPDGKVKQLDFNLIDPWSGKRKSADDKPIISDMSRYELEFVGSREYTPDQKINLAFMQVCCSKIVPLDIAFPGEHYMFIFNNSRVNDSRDVPDLRLVGRRSRR